MFGFYRLILALMVMADHLTKGSGYRGFSFGGLGNCAVYGFFVVSGYLMTLVLNRTYEFDGRRFWFNRFLRLYPSYFFVCGFTTIAILLWPTAAAAYHETFRVTTDFGDWIGTIAIFPLPFHGSNFRPVPPIWSVGVELVMYFALFIFIARRRSFAVGALLVGLAYTIVANLPAFNWDNYSSLRAALLPFSAGAVIYFFQSRLALSATWLKRALVIVTATSAANLVVFAHGGNFLRGFYLNLALCIALVALLSQVTGNDRAARKLDKFAGDLAYPVFLLHWGVGFYVSVFLPGDSTRGFDLLAWSFPLVLLLGTLIIYLIDRPIERLRSRVRARTSA